MLSFNKLTKNEEINSEKPKYDNEFERMNKTANTIMILHTISFLIFEKLVSL